jgi:hypothetical protein
MEHDGVARAAAHEHRGYLDLLHDFSTAMSFEP